MEWEAVATIATSVILTGFGSVAWATSSIAKLTVQVTSVNAQVSSLNDKAAAMQLDLHDLKVRLSDQEHRMRRIENNINNEGTISNKPLLRRSEDR